jgi:hypothetical protein
MANNGLIPKEDLAADLLMQAAGDSDCMMDLIGDAAKTLGLKSAKDHQALYVIAHEIHDFGRSRLAQFLDPTAKIQTVDGQTERVFLARSRKAGSDDNSIFVTAIITNEVSAEVAFEKACALALSRGEEVASIFDGESFHKAVRA